MTRITFFKKDGIYYGFHEQGHTGYADAGDDVLCAALSSMTMLIVNAIEVSYASDVSYTIDEESTDITVVCKAALPAYAADEKRSYAISGLFQAYFLQLTDMTEDYYDYIEVEETEKDI